MFIFIDITQLSKIFKQMTGFCQKCHQQRELTLLKTYQCFRIFFIPVWHWGERYYIVDDICGAMYEISEEDAVLIKYDKKDINTCVLQGEVQTAMKCHACGKALDEQYDFCPYCGQKRK